MHSTDILEDSHVGLQKLLTMQESLTKHCMCPRGYFLVGIIKQDMNSVKTGAQLVGAKQ